MVPIPDLGENCISIDCDCQVCLSDVEKLFTIDRAKGCAYNEIDEYYAMFQCIEITICFLAIFTIAAKICAIHFDNKTVNKLVLYQFLAFQFWTFSHMLKIMALFFVNPHE